MAGRTHGRNAAIYIDPSSAANGSASSISYLNSWTLDQSADTVDVTSFGDGSKVYVSGLPDAAGSMNGFVNIGTAAFTNIIGDDTARKMYLYPDTNTATTYFFCTAYFSGSYEGSSGDAIKVSMNWNAASTGTWVSGF